MKTQNPPVDKPFRPSAAGVHGWINGDCKPSGEYLRFIRRILGCREDDLFEGNRFSGQKLKMLIEVKGWSMNEFARKLLFAVRDIIQE